MNDTSAFGETKVTPVPGAGGRRINHLEGVPHPLPSQRVRSSLCVCWLLMRRKQKWPANHFLADLPNRSTPRTERRIGTQHYLKLGRGNRLRQPSGVQFPGYTHKPLFTTSASCLQPQPVRSSVTPWRHSADQRAQPTLCRPCQATRRS
jgi:hypothetical protein